MADERSWDLIYSAVIDLTKAVNNIREEIKELRHETKELRQEMNVRFDRIEERMDRLEHDNKYTKIRLFDAENEISFLKETRRA